MSLMNIQVTPLPKSFGKTGRFFKVVSCSETLKVRFVFLDDSEAETELYQGLAVEFTKEYKAFYISAESEQTATIFASSAKLIDDRLETSLTGSASLESEAVNLSANVITEIVPARLGRRSVLIFCDDVAYIGGANLTANNGILVDAGSSIEINTQAAIYALSPNASTVKTLSEVN